VIKNVALLKEMDVVVANTAFELQKTGCILKKLQQAVL
jgi:hypothetical protein